MALPSADRLAELSPEAREILREILKDLSNQARERAEKSWRSHKAPMAAYWKAVAVYARHISVALRRAA
ncbi:putative membrane protein [Labrenzia sp. EL_208]|nr:putative membrane protein [Labrenzia sp. EL_132]MBG6232963.1 putative membrane protein [Labrenzia sp. EL_208]